MKSRATILFVSAFDAPFIRDDLNILLKHFDVRARIGHGFRKAISLLVGLMACDVVFCWFASVYAALGVIAAKALGVKSLIVIGGVDVARDKDLGYGIWLSSWKSALVKYALRNADLVLAVDPSLKTDAMELADYDGRNILYLPTGYNVSFWKPMGERELAVLTVAVVNDNRRVRVKGIDVLFDAARMLPEISFKVIGIAPHVLSGMNPPSNVVCSDVIKREQLLPMYRNARVYCQPSRREGLANTLCEAMACGCMPVATDVGGNRSAVGDTGILVPPDDHEALAAALVEALSASEHQRARARARIVALFPQEKRELELLRLIRGLLV